MFKPIIHNLTEDIPGFAEVQAYNKLITQKPKGDQWSLANKIKAQRDWALACNAALEVARAALKQTA